MADNIDTVGVPPATVAANAEPVNRLEFVTLRNTTQSFVLGIFLEDCSRL